MKYLLAVCCYNEGEKIRRVVEKFSEYHRYDVLLLDDGSSDASLDRLKRPGLQFRIVRNPVNRGVGYTIRRAVTYARERGYDVLITVAGNDKDDPRDVIKLIREVENGFDFVQGSRYLSGGSFGNMPLYRRMATQYVHPWLFSLFARRKTSDSTNGFRAVRLSFLNDSRIDIGQDWLDHYELEPYLYYKALRLGYRVKEVPVTKVYPPKELGYTKMKPITGWWSILRPIFLLGLGIKK